MRYLFTILVIVMFSPQMYSQNFEVGVFGGGSNFIGDVGNSTFIWPNAPVGGLIGKWNRSPRHAFRLSLLYAKLNADDTKSSDNRRQQRAYTFENSVAEASLGLEFNFWSYDLSEATKQSTPYLYTGITYFRADHMYLKNGRNNGLVNEGSNWEFSIPMVMGYKESITRDIIGAVEIGARYTFTDNLDGSWPSEYLGQRAPSIEFGNRNTNDWYVFSGFTFTFTFGRKPCYCF